MEYLQAQPQPRNDINLDMLIWLSESSLSVLFSEVSQIRDLSYISARYLTQGSSTTTGDQHTSTNGACSTNGTRST